MFHLNSRVLDNIAMLHKGLLRRNARQIYAIVEKEINLQLRFKSQFLFILINPLIQLVVYFFLFGAIFNIQQGIAIGYWNSSNYLLFLLIAMSISYSQPIIQKYTQLFATEKYWKTLSAIMIAPVNRISLLVGILISQILLSSIGVIFLLTLAFILFPITIFELIFFIFTYLCILLIFGSIGLILGAFAISNENFQNYYFLVIRFLFLLSCINYPKELFPEIIQFFITLNPLYYLFDFLRLIWYSGLSPTTAFLYISPIHIITFILVTILSPIIAVLLFERIYKKHGITGY